MNSLKSAVKGRVLVAGDEGFEQAARPWNLAVQQPVRAVVEAVDADDVAALVSHAALAGLTVTAQPSGHGATGDTDGLILLRTGRLDGVEIDPAARTAKVGAGVKWGSVQEAAGPYGLTGLTGSSPVVSVVGYTLGGGMSWFGRKHGFASDSVRAFDVVDASGQRARVTADSDAELFWALRGGGGDFALVTGMEFDLHPAPALYGGRLLWTAERAAEVLAAFREVTAVAPEELTLWLDLLHFPGAEPMVAIDLTYLGAAEEARDLLRPFDEIGGSLSDSRAEMKIADLGSITAEPTDPGAGHGRTELLTGLDDDVTAILLEDPIAPLLSVQLRHLGGALARPGGGAAGSLAEPYSVFLFGLAHSPELSAAVRERQEGLVKELVSHTAGRKPFTTLSPGERAAAAFPGDVLARLRDVKRARDPHGVLRSNYPVLD